MSHDCSHQIVDNQQAPEYDSDTTGFWWYRYHVGGTGIRYLGISTYEQIYQGLRRAIMAIMGSQLPRP